MENSESLDWIRKDLKKRGIDPLSTRNDLPVGYSHKHIVPVRGSVHISSGRVISRFRTNLYFLFPFLKR